MKREIIILCVLFASIFTFAQSQTATVVATRNQEGSKVYVLDNGYEVWTEGPTYLFHMVNNEGKVVASFWGNSTPNKLWSNVDIGRKVSLNEVKDVVSRYKIYLPVVLNNYTVERTVEKVNRYDGSLAKIEGKTSGNILSSSGSLQGEAASSENFYINIYFVGQKKPVPVNVKENQLWLEVKPGDKVIERRINGVLYYSPKF
jgi:hypothetical protein